MADKGSTLVEFYTLLRNTEAYLTDGYSKVRNERVTIAWPIAKNHHPEPTRPFLAKKVAKKTDIKPSAEPYQVQYATFAALAEQLTQCNSCHFEPQVTPFVGNGNLKPQVLIVADDLSRDDYELNEVLRGAAGQFLDKWLQSIGLNRYEHCYLTSLVKCYQGHHLFNAEIVSKCRNFLFEQIALLSPEAILVCGAESAQLLTGQQGSIEDLRQEQYFYRDIPLVITHHPKIVLKNTQLKRDVWEDLKILRKLLADSQKIG